MIKELRDFYKRARRYSNGVTRIAATGGSGAGKTTSAANLMDEFARQFIYSNIGAIQSSKLRLVMIPVYQDAKSKNTCSFDICFMEKPNTDLIMQETRRSIVNKLILAYRSFDESDDVEDIVDKILKPENRAYDILEYCSEEKRNVLIDLVKDICIQLLNGNEEYSCLSDKISELKKDAERKGKKFNQRECAKKELDTRISLYSLEDIEDVILDIILGIRRKIEDTMSSLQEQGLDVEMNNNTFSIYIDESTGELANKMFEFIFQKDGKDMVVSHLVYIVSMSAEAVEVFYPESKVRTLSEKESMPCFKLYDLKGLEAGADSIDETILKLRESMPDAILVYQRTTDISDFFMKYIDAIHDEFKKVSLHAILSHSDEAVKSYLRTSLQSFGAVRKDDEGYGEFYNTKVNEAYNRLVQENSIYEHKINEGDREGKVIYCSLIDESEEIDRILGNNALYCPQKIIQLISDICNSNKSLWQKIKVLDNQREQVENISFSFDEKKLQDFAERFVNLHNANAYKQYYSQASLCPHWNTVYKWRATHRVGSGWTSSAKVYDNISIYVSNVISGMINKEDIANAIVINFPENFTEEACDLYRERLMSNIMTDLSMYNGFYYNIKLALSYSGLNGFESTYYSNALKLIYESLNNVEYIKNTMNRTIEDYTQIFLTRTLD